MTKRTHKQQAKRTLHRLLAVIPYVTIGMSVKEIVRHTGFTEQQVRYLRKRLKKILK